MDDVIRKVLPRYRSGQATVLPADYAADIQQILNASNIDSKSHREKLLKAWESRAFWQSMPGRAYPLLREAHASLPRDAAVEGSV